MKLRYKIATWVFILFVGAVIVLGTVLSYNEPCASGPEDAGGTERMRAIVYSCYGPPEVLSLEEVPRPQPAADELLVRVRAASVNPLDWHYMRGLPYIMRVASGIGAPDDTRLGVDFAGTVEAVGDGVTKFEVGDEVFGGATGAFAEYVTVRQDSAVGRKPANLSFEQAAAVPIAGVTALQALRDKGRIGPGQKVLINGASGGVGTFAVQIAKSFGAEVTGVSSTRNVELVRSLGADQVFDYTREDYTRSGQVWDVIVDMVGNHSIGANRAVLEPGGILVIVGGPKGDWIAPIVSPVKALVIEPFVDEELVGLMARLVQEDLVILGELMAAGEVTPVIDRRYGLSEVPDAIRYSETGRARGKIVITTDPTAP
jgi:NADPH:quinone reductase-like Zn-dependent oxidoreductase